MKLVQKAWNDEKFGSNIVLDFAATKYYLSDSTFLMTNAQLFLARRRQNHHMVELDVPEVPTVCNLCCDFVFYNIFRPKQKRLSLNGRVLVPSTLKH